MSGRRLLFDTNAIIHLLQGNQELISLSTQADFICISIVNKIEFLAFPNIQQTDKKIFEQGDCARFIV